MGRPEKPVDPDAGVLQAFAYDLRRLRRSAGSPSYRQMARTAHYSASALSTAASGASLPSWNVTRAFVQACGGDVEQWDQRWRQLAAELEPDELDEDDRDGIAAEDKTQSTAVGDDQPAPRSSPPHAEDRRWRPILRRGRAAASVVGVTVIVTVITGVVLLAAWQRDGAPGQVRSTDALPTPAATLSAASSSAIVATASRQAAPPVESSADTVAAAPPPGGLVVGPGCPLDDRRDYSLFEQHDDGWRRGGGGWTGDGCVGRTFSTRVTDQEGAFAYPLQWKESYLWQVKPGLAGPARCVLAVHVPDAAQAAGPAIYRVFVTGNAAGDSIADVVADQAAHHGAWVAHQVIVPDAADLTIRLVDAGHGRYTIAADAISVACSR
ncbi:helix-turn-helix domain-containing protein [Acrocarpospora sp. B8E8]|uniref:helix-turn-helix domain-containing protein n=1 Tax=Acrocarpospora sp. B8E8 TaxID=3153572 RepID=UPI00325E193B